jgi:hypothetical protein
MKIRDHLKKWREQLRAELKELFGHSIYEAAAYNKLAIEYLEGMPAKYTGHLDTHEEPRFIAVNPDLSEQDQVYVIAREIGRYAQLRRIDSPLLYGPRKWDLLATAPNETRNLILELDLEVRAYWIMYWHAGKKNFFGFFKRHRKKYLAAMFSNAISDYIFWKLRIQTLIFKFFYTLALYER